MPPKIIFLTSISLFVLFLSSYSQDIKSTKPAYDQTTKIQGNKPDLTLEKDFKIISSNSSYIEIEYYPKYSQPQEVAGEQEKFIQVSFDNALSSDPSKSGSPDLQYRSFTVILPSSQNNNLAVLEYDVKEANNVNLTPLPYYRYTDPRKIDMEHLEQVYKKDPTAYSQNKVLPAEIVSLENISAARDVLFGNICVHPYQYNPVSRALKQYTRIRFRLSFGNPPVMVNRKRSYEEYMFLKDIAVNSGIAVNWMDPAQLRLQPPRRLENSVLATGDWYKIEIKDFGNGTSDGIYKLSKSFLESAGINLSNIDPRTIKIYGNGGDLLPEELNDPRPNDLVQCAIYVEGENDGHFDANDYILFYGRSTYDWKYDYSSHRFSHYIDYYTYSNIYWLTYGGANGNRMALQPSDSVENPAVVTSSTEKDFFEPEFINLLDEGNLWLGGMITNGESFTWNGTQTGLEANTDILYKIKPASRVVEPPGFHYENHMVLKENYSIMSPITFPMGVVHPDWGNWIWTDTTSFIINASQKSPPNSEHSSFSATFFTNAPGGEGYIDWMEMQYKRRLNSVTSDLLHFTSPDQTGVFEYSILPFSSSQIKVFDVTRHNDVRMIRPLSSAPNSFKFQKSGIPDTLSYFIAVGPTGYKTPSSISLKQPNQNIHGYSEGADFIIISTQELLPAANRIKAKREQGGTSNPNYLKTYIISIQNIYNEFSGGLLDAVAIRDFLKYTYDNWQLKPVYVLLLGDGSYDYRNIYEASYNLIPPFEYTDPQLNQVSTYATDDYYVEFLQNSTRPFLAIGRVPVRNLDEANGYVDKTDCYEDPSYNNPWKNRVVYVADDGWTPSGCEGDLHTAQMERLAQNHTPPSFEKIKIYSIMYPYILTSGGRRKPGVNADIVKNWNDGCIGVNYAGHGSPDLWSNEHFFDKDVIVSQLNNLCKYPIVTVASCDFSKYDSPLDFSGGEILAAVRNKGAIGTLGASRPTYSADNEALHNYFYDYLFGMRDTLLLQTRFGKAVYLTKQHGINNINYAKFVLLCDPTARVQIPRFESRVDSIAGLWNDTMRALSRVKVYGSVMHADSSSWSDFNGQINLKILDADKHIVITQECGGTNYTYNFMLPGGIIFSGKQKVTNGLWNIEFIVPKDLSYMNTNGKIMDYFWNNQNDGSGIYNNFIVGGIDPSATADTTGPLIKLYLNNRNFRNADVVNENFTLIGDLFDESGINTTGTIGHKIEATIDGDERNKYDVTSFYNSDTSYKSGSLEYKFYSLAEGKHTLKLTAWDTYNNSSSVQIDFTVSTYNKLNVMNVFNYPNPFKDKTSFTFQHNYPYAINVRIRIFTVSGRLIQEIKRDNISDKFVAIDWDGKDGDGETLANGVYLYKLMVTTGDGSNVTSIGKMAVLR